MLVCALLSHLPQSSSLDLTYTVMEGKSRGSYVGDVASDSDLMNRISSKDRNMITFSQLQQSTSSDSKLFRVSKITGSLYTAKMLDAETMCKRYKDCYKTVNIAVQKGTSFITLLEVKVKIQDVNDHRPEFPHKQVNIEFEEDDSKGARRPIPHAIDRDVGVVNSRITYELKKDSSNPFMLAESKNEVGTSDLSIVLRETLDREIRSHYRLQVVARDGGSPPKQSILDVHISVIDVNDNPPIFSQNIYNVSIRNEPSKTTPVVILSATDLDSGENGKTSYHFSFQTSENLKAHFKLNEVTGEIFLYKEFKLGQEFTNELYVKATDGGSPPLSSFAKVLVNVINQRNNAPNIEMNFVSESNENTVAISEDIEVGSFIAYVKVNDHDAGRNGEVNCDLHHSKFQLQSLDIKKYKIILKDPLDRETEDHHDITISCRDKGSPPLYSENKFAIKLIDVNDVRPRFPKKMLKFWVFENQKSNIPAGFINATDPDLGPGGKLTYSLQSKDKQFVPFQIREDGLISTIISLDHEFQKMYKFQVLAKDNGIPPLNNTIDVIVEVRDENDNIPYFTYPSVNPFSLDVLYFPHHTKNITVLKASDSDSRENAFLKYEISRGNDKQLFTINHYTGLLSFSRALGPQDTGSYELEFIVKDSGSPVLSASTTIFLTLTISNKTSGMLNAVQIRTDDKVHLNLAVVIVLGAVTLAVIITASVSVCFLRCHSRSSTSSGECQASTNRYVNEQRHLMCRSQVGVPVAMTDPCKKRNIPVTSPRRGSHPADKFGNQQVSAKNPQTMDIMHQMPIQELSHSCEKDLRSGSVITTTYPSCGSTKSFQVDSGHGWSEDDIEQSEAGSDLTTQYCNSPSSQGDQFQDISEKSSKQVFHVNSKESAVPTRCFHKQTNGPKNNNHPHSK